MKHILAAIVGFALLAGCTTENDLAEKPVDLGGFQLGHTVVVASKTQKGPGSRDVTEEEWVTALTKSINDRFGRYEGENLYHIATSVEGYILAPVGVPVVLTLKSALILNVTVWDDAAGRKYNDEVKQLTIFEDTDAESAIVGSGASRTREEQLAGLSFNAAKAIENWLVEMHEDHGWFTKNAVYNPKPKEKPRPQQ